MDLLGGLVQVSGRLEVGGRKECWLERESLYKSYKGEKSGRERPTDLVGARGSESQHAQLTWRSRCTG